MTATRTAVLAVVVLVAGAIFVAPASSAVTADASSAQDQEPSDDTRAMGTEVSSFMQSSAADTDESVESEMFAAAYENADNDTRDELVTQRATGLERKLERLEREHAEIRENEDGMNRVAYNARLARLAVQISALERAIDDAHPRAVEAGIDTAALEELRGTAMTLSGPEIAQIAREIAGIEPPEPRGDNPDATENSDRSRPAGSDGGERPAENSGNGPSSSGTTDSVESADGE